ncbi:MAG: nicotinamide-nucleotide amidohydrolase family protein [Bacteroidetes bacterium]|nr:nicotinamide-nucleotide amidohydrolase family protein [Bacteroidota bacterium]
MLNLFDTKNVRKIKEGLGLREETIAVSESVTSGFIQAALASAEEASMFFQGGITAYNLGQKYRHLQVEPIHAQACNCVSEKVADEMAINVCSLFNSNWGIGITGYATPVPESDNKLFAYYSVAHNGKIILARKIDAFKDDTLVVQLFYVNESLRDLAAYLSKPKTS